jgi:DNA-binding SARP family transcriptional activator
VVRSVEMDVEPTPLGAEQRTPSIEIRMLGPLTVSRHGASLELPASRKARALVAYLSLAHHPVKRNQLCELLWDVPNDPRGELRWCLSKIRRLLDEAERPRVDTRADTVSLDVADCFVDAIEIARAAQNVDAVAVEQLRTLVAMFAGDFLDGLEIEHSPVYTGWLIAQRRRFRGYHAALLENLGRNVPDAEALGYLETWLELAPFDRRAHELLLRALVRCDRIREAEEHFATATRLFEAEGLDGTPLREAWRSAKAHEERLPGATVSATADESRGDRPSAEPHRASVAVMPFDDCSTITEGGGGQAGALAHDVITGLAKLRNLFVIAQGTVFALHERHIGSDQAGRMLNVEYVTSGTLRRQGDRLSVTVELAETRTGRLIWTEAFDQKLDDAFHMSEDIAGRIVASIASEIESSERNRAVLRPPNSLDAWEAHHRGLWHAYRFNRLDNERAQNFFEMAVRLDPTFARAYAGLSFAHFQNVFQGWREREPETDRAFEAAAQSLMVDERDPAAHWAMGRALWLRGHHDQSIDELEQAIDLSPNFALGHYTLAFVHAQAGDPYTAVASSDRSRRLSPFDPLLFGMLGARAMALVRMGRFDEAAECGMQAAGRPNAHAHIRAIAAFTLALAGRHDEARAYLSSIQKVLPRYGVDDFLTAMRFDVDGERLFRDAAKRLGL